MMLPKSKLTKLVVLIALPLFMMHLASCAHTTPLTAAAEQNNTSAIKELLKNGAKIDETNSGKWTATPLYWSLNYCKYDAAELLLRKGANPNLVDSFGLSPLQVAVCCKDLDISVIEHLIEKGADINYSTPSDPLAKPFEGWTSLHYAISCGADEAARLLIEKGASVNAIADDGTTPLIIAAKNDSLFMAKFMLDKGADVNWRDLKKKSAMSYAKGILGILHKKKKMMELLESFGGE
jgi:ankyrin repeat protein